MNRRKSLIENTHGRPATTAEMARDGRAEYGKLLREWRLSRSMAADVVACAIQSGVSPERWFAIEAGAVAPTDAESARIGRWRRAAPRALNEPEHEAWCRWHRKHGSPRRTYDRGRA